MKYTRALFTLFIVSTMPQITKAMLVTGALNEIEKAVFLKEVNRIGKETASVHIECKRTSTYYSR
jgi:hypothetical protein